MVLVIDDVHNHMQHKLNQLKNWFGMITLVGYPWEGRFTCAWAKAETRWNSWGNIHGSLGLLGPL